MTYLVPTVEPIGMHGQGVGSPATHSWLEGVNHSPAFNPIRNPAQGSNLADRTDLKGVCYEIFDLHFFHDSNPSRPLINRLKYFRIWFRFRRDILILKKLRGVHSTLESDSTVCITPQSQTPRCVSHLRDKLHGVHHTAESSDHIFLKKSTVCIPHSVCIIPPPPPAESDSAVCIIPRSQAKWCASLVPGVKLSGVHPTTESSSTVQCASTVESSSAVCIKQRSGTAHRRIKIEIFVSLWLLLKGQLGEIILGVNTSSFMKQNIWENKFY